VAGCSRVGHQKHTSANIKKAVKVRSTAARMTMSGNSEIGIGNTLLQTQLTRTERDLVIIISFPAIALRLNVSPKTL